MRYFSNEVLIMEYIMIVTDIVREKLVRDFTRTIVAHGNESENNFGAPWLFRAKGSGKRNDGENISQSVSLI